MANETSEAAKGRARERAAERGVGNTAPRGLDPNHQNYGRTTSAAEHAKNMGERETEDHHARPDGRPNPDPAPTESPPPLIGSDGTVNPGDDIGIVEQKPSEGV